MSPEEYKEKKRQEQQEYIEKHLTKKEFEELKSKADKCSEQLYLISVLNIQ